MKFYLMATLILLGLLAFCFNNIVFFVVGVGLLVSALIVDKGFPELGPGENAGDRFEPVPPLSGTQAPPRLRHRDGPRHVRILTIARPSSVLFDQDQP